jgi:hypothetical protein
MKFEKSSTTLSEILNCQRSPFDKTVLGYSEKKEVSNEEASTSSKQSSEERTESYAYIIKNVSRLKTTRRKNNMIHRRKIFLTRTESGRLSHQDEIT